MGDFKIGFDAKRLFCNNTGLGNYSRQLVANYKSICPGDDLSLFSPRFPDNADTAPFLGDEYKRIGAKGISASWWRSYGVVKDINKDDVDIYHGLSNELPFNIQKAQCTSVVSIHDLIYKFHPEDFPLFDRTVYDMKFKHSCKASDAIIAVSEHTKKDIIKYFGVDPQKISVIYQSCSPEFKKERNPKKIDWVMKKYNIPQQFILYVGSVIERKNLLSVVKAIKALKGVIKAPLVVIGQGKAYKEKVLQYVKKHQLEDLVIFPGYVSNEDLPYFYQKAKVFVYPSFYEGFGIPIIEALSSRTPVIAANTTSLPEAGGPGAIYINPHEPKEIADGIVRIFTLPQLYTQMINEGYDYVHRFNKDKTSNDLKVFYEKMMNLQK